MAAPPHSPARAPGAAGRLRRGLPAICALVAAWLGVAAGAPHDAGAPAAAVPPPVAAEGPASFRHDEPQHARLPCLLCHRRETNSPRPTLPGHKPCSGCHVEEFAGAAGPICGVCHTSSGSGAVKPFPRLRSFDARFDHATHARGAARPRAGCAACHAPARRGVARSVPAGTGAHATCFDCHRPRAESGGRRIDSCATCHALGPYGRARGSSRAYRVSFGHAAHTRRGLSCRECHAVRPGAPRGRQVTSPVPAQHHAPAGARSCMTCHDGKRAFGGDNFSDCKRCHTGDTWRF